MAIVIEVIELGRDYFENSSAKKNPGRETVSNSRIRCSGGRRQSAVPADSITDGRSGFILLRKSRDGEKNEKQVLQHPAPSPRGGGRQHCHRNSD